MLKSLRSSLYSQCVDLHERLKKQFRHFETLCDSIQGQIRGSVFE